MNRVIHFATGMLSGAIVLVVLYALGLPDIFQIMWGGATALGVWLYFEPKETAEEIEARITDE